MMELRFTGRVWVLTDTQGRPYSDIDTDQIFHNAHLHITRIEEMGAFALGNLDGWRDFPQKARTGDIVVAGENFGSGSSRQQAVDCFRALGVSLIVAGSFGAIYKRNAINTAFPITTAQGIPQAVAAGHLQSGQQVTVDLEGGVLKTSDGMEIRLDPLSQVQKDILACGNLMSL